MGCSTVVEGSEVTKVSFQEYLSKSRMLKFGLAFSLFYYLCVLVVFIYLLAIDSVDSTVYTMDFQVFYEAGQTFLTSPGAIYSVNPNGLPFRYLPAFAAFVSIFSAVPLFPSYLMNITLMITLSFCIVYLVYEVSLKTGVEVTTKNFEKTLTIVAITPPHVVNLILGQISHLVIVLILIVLLLLVTSSEHQTSRHLVIGIIVGVAITLKPFCIVFLPFLVPISLKGRFRINIPVKQFVGVACGLVISMLPNIVYFSEYPLAFIEFLQVNLVDGLSFHHSTSITRLGIALLPFLDTNIVQYSIILVVGGYIFWRSYISFIRAPMNRKSYSQHFAMMMFLVLLIYPDSWFLFLAFWYAFLAPSMLQFYTSADLSKETSKRLDLLWSGSNNLLAFFSIGIVFHYLVLGFDPLIPLWLVALYLLYQHVSGQLNT